MNHDALVEACRNLALFPLPGVVMLPGLMMPLHVFEPRYRRLVLDCLAESRPLAVPQIMPGHEVRAPDSPPLLSYAGVGFIAGHRERPDGRFDILLQPLGRVRLGAEIAGDAPYRSCDAELLQDTEVDPDQLRRVGERIRARLLLLLERSGERGEGLARMVREARPGSLADGAAGLVLDDAEVRQQFLAENDALRRAAMVEEALCLRSLDPSAAAEA